MALTLEFPVSLAGFDWSFPGALNEIVGYFVMRVCFFFPPLDILVCYVTARSEVAAKVK